MQTESFLQQLGLKSPDNCSILCCYKLLSPVELLAHVSFAVWAPETCQILQTEIKTTKITTL